MNTVNTEPIILLHFFLLEYYGTLNELECGIGNFRTFVITIESLHLINEAYVLHDLSKV